MDFLSRARLCSTQIRSGHISKLLIAFSISLAPQLSHADTISASVAPDIQEPAGIYENTPSLINMQAKTVIGTGLCDFQNNAGCTLQDILNDTDKTDNFTPKIRVHFTADDYPDDGLASNASMRLRGTVSRLAPQKSFRIKLDKTVPLWQGQRRIQLVKSFYDLSRVRNKLSFDLFKTIPHLPSLRTQFAKLSINDQGSSKDYGLYTVIEHVGKEYLSRRGWNIDSGLYKPEVFYYQDDPALALDATGKPLDLNAFEKILEIKRGKDHRKLLEMIKAVNNPALDFNTQVFNKYFNRDNYLTWFAVNILVNNTDTDAHNFYLYNPKGTEKFYILPWDYDFAWGSNRDLSIQPIEQLPRWWFSHANWHGNILHKRFLNQPGNLALLKQAVSEIKNKYLKPEQIQALSDSYRDIVFPLVTSNPDFGPIELEGNTDPERIAQYNQIFDRLAQNVEFNYARFLERQDDPMPFFMNPPQFLPNHDIQFSWEESLSLLGQTISYDLEIATTKEFKAGTIIERIKNIATTSHKLHWTHPKGTYYFRVISRDTADPQGHWQNARGTELTFDNTVEIFGVKTLKVTEDGTPNPGGSSSGGTSSGGTSSGGTSSGGTSSGGTSSGGASSGGASSGGASSGGASSGGASSGGASSGGTSSGGASSGGTSSGGASSGGESSASVPSRKGGSAQFGFIVSLLLLLGARKRKGT